MFDASREYLCHILDECAYLASAVGSLTLDQFQEQETLKRAVVRSLEIIGEASKKIPAEDKARWTEIPWRSMAGMRDKLIHNYMGVDYEIVWDVVRNVIPGLADQIAELLHQAR
ncbi:MAG: DUF86 domain-containing protein [Bacteroidia bacterium]|nr:DUF86 domain-containing protein [Bacteroidia bacterium]